MPITTMPAVDANATSGWTEQQINLYNALPYYMAKMQVDRRKDFTLWRKFCGALKWQPNMGDIVKSVRKVPSPHVRQFAFPKIYSQMPNKDVMQVREVQLDTTIYRHRFESPIMNFVPSFRDFMTDHVDANGKDIMEKMERFEDIYYRGNIFHMAPYVFVVKEKGNVELIPAPSWNSNGAFTAANDGKTSEWIKANVLPKIGSHLTLVAANQMTTIAENDLGIPPFQGSGLPADNAGLQDKFCLVLSSEAYNRFTFDKFLLQYKNTDLNLQNGGFKGLLWGRVTCKIEDKPLRFTKDVLYKNPEITEEDENNYNKGEPVPNPQYTSPDNDSGSPVEIGFFVGAQGYDIVNVGPPPAAFASNNPPDNFARMFWNGEVQITKKFLIKALDAAGTEVYEMNTYGEYLKFISQATYGIRGRQRRNIIPVFYARNRYVES